MTAVVAPSAPDTDASQTVAPDGLPETESQLVETAQIAVSRCNWVVGRCAAEWTERYARGRTDADFAALVGLSADQVYQRRRVWETFADVREQYETVAAPGSPKRGPRWSHFYVALTWDDAPECLEWASENEATVAEMKAYRRALHGEDLSAPAARGPADDFAGDPSVIRLPTDPVPVRDPDEFAGPAGERPPWDEDGADSARPPAAMAALRETASGESGEDGDETGGDGYAPFSAGAVTPPGGESGSDAEDKTDSNAARLAKTLQRVDATLTEGVMDSFRHLSDSRRGDIAESARAVLGKLQILSSLDEA
ncbi:hypothetical protein [Alienimonas chondri]|uniref:Uncharacterized protein n=1 Tax=Alienimonas chondri TaxID=2681879 RepID=A0ABX1V9N1_9PLAN|nr:hypothetical protein [Alienimonas chondri]NNJ24483.1 hypothetical protein [Alienimonas chondri]